MTRHPSSAPTPTSRRGGERLNHFANARLFVDSGAFTAATLGITIYLADGGYKNLELTINAHALASPYRKGTQP